MVHRRWGLALSVAGLVGWYAEARGQTTFNWNAAGGGSYHTAGNWTPAGGPPIFDDFANFNLNSTYTVSFTNAGTQTIDFQVRQGTVTFAYLTGTAQHFWGGSGTNRVGPQAGDAAASATLNLTNMSNNPMSGHTLQIGYAAGKTGTMNINTNGRWQGYATSSVTVGSLGTGHLHISTTGILQNSSLSAYNVSFGESGGTGNGTVSGLNAALNVSNVLTIGSGNNSLGNVTVSNAGKINVADSVFLGVVSKANNQLTVTGTNSELVLGNDLLAVGYAQGTGTLQVLSGGKVTNSNNSSMYFGYDAGSQGNLLVTGSGSQFQSTGSQILYIGDLGNASATVSTGATLEVARLRIGYGAGSVSTMTVTGTSTAVNLTGSSSNSIGQSGQGSLFVQNNAQLNSAGMLEIGFSGSGSMTISGGADVISNSARLGTLAGSSGQVTLTGAGSTWNADSSGSLLAGQSGTGSITVSDGATMTAGAFSLGSSVGGQGSMEVSGLNTTWNSNGTIFIGDAGTGSALLNFGGKLIGTAGANMHVGFAAGSAGSLQLTDPGSMISLNAGSTFNIGTAGLGDAVIRNGATASLAAITIGRESTGVGSLVITDANTSVTQLAPSNLTVAQNGTGSLLVKNGASLSTNNTRIGTGFSGEGTATVTGLNTLLSTSGYLSLGGTSTEAGGTGTLHINNSGQVNVGTSLYLWGEGTLQLNGGTVHLNNIVDNGGNFLWNTGTVNFKQNTVVNNTLADILFAGADHTLNNGKTLSATGFTLVANTPMIVDGGKIEATGYTNIGTTWLKNGNITLTGNFLNDVQGTMLLQGIGQMLVPGTLQNNGLWVMQSLASKSTGGVFQNAGIVTGSGQLQHQFINQNTGTVDLQPADRLIVNSPLLESTNLGTIQLVGGRLDFTGQLNNAPGGFISGRGVLATSTAAPGNFGLLNRGIITFSAGTGDIFGDVRHEGSGQVITTGGAVTTFHDDVEHNGLEIRTSEGSRTVFLGSVSGASPYTGVGLVQYEGDLRPGNSPANVQYEGDIEFSATARLVIELGGIIPGSQHDRLTVQGAVTLNGLLDVRLLDGYIPAPGQQFTIIDNLGSDAVLGTFAGLPEGTNFMSEGYLYTISYQGGTGNDVMLIAVPEPTTWALIGITALAGGGMYYRRRQRAADEADVEMTSL